MNFSIQYFGMGVLFYTRKIAYTSAKAKPLFREMLYLSNNVIYAIIPRSFLFSVALERLEGSTCFFPYKVFLNNQF